VKKLCRKSGKVKFASHEQAAIRAGELLQKSETKMLRTYRCAFCNHWHLTSK